MLCRWTLTSTLLFTHLQFMSSHYYHHQSPILLLDPLWEGETLSEEEQKEERSLWANAHLLSDLHMELIIKQTVFDRFFTPPNNVFWTHLSGADGQSKTLCNDTINCVVFSLLCQTCASQDKQQHQLKATEKQVDPELRHFCLFKCFKSIYVYIDLTKPSSGHVNYRRRPEEDFVF